MRGNHESRQITGVYGFYDEIMRKYGNGNAWIYCCEVFDCLNIAAVVEGEVFCVHAGLSPDIKTIDQINLIDRRVEIPHEGPFCDMMWSDPEEIDSWAMSARGAGWLYGMKVVKDFNQLNNLKLIVRSHQLVQEGFKYMFEEKLVTLWSAPNYCYRCGNLAAILVLDSSMNISNEKYKIFSAVSDINTIQNYKNVVPYFL